MIRRLLLAGGVLAGPLFLATATAEGARRPDYSQRRHPISSLALGPRGWVQRANFWTTGALYLGGAAAIPPGTTGRLPLAVAGSCLLVSGQFVTDPVSGYPAGTPGLPDQPTSAGKVHDASAVPVFVGLPILQLALAVRYARRGQLGWAGWTAATAAAMGVGTVGMATAFSQHPRWVPYGGVFQRVAVVSGLGWLSATAGRALR